MTATLGRAPNTMIRKLHCLPPSSPPLSPLQTGLTRKRRLAGNFAFGPICAQSEYVCNSHILIVRRHDGLENSGLQSRTDLDLNLAPPFNYDLGQLC